MRFQFTPMMRNLLILNAGIFIVSSLMKIDVNSILGLHYYNSSYFFPTQFFTYMFAHGDLGHLLSNSVSIILAGQLLEKVWGGKRFLIYYIFCGLGGGLIYFFIHSYEVGEVLKAAELYKEEPSFEYFMKFERAVNVPLMTPEGKEMLDQETVPSFVLTETSKIINEYSLVVQDTTMIGASGCAFGLFMAMLLLFPNTEVFRIAGTIPVKVKYIVLVMIILEVKNGLVKVPGDHVAHFAHIGGALFGFILVKYWQKQRNTFY